MAFKYLSEAQEKQGAPSKPTVFLVEGQDDGIFLEHILDERGEDPSEIEIMYVQGVKRLWNYLEALVKSPNFVERRIARICVLIDADIDFKAVEAKAQAHFKRAGLAEPKSSEIADKDGVRVGLYVFPNSNDKGELEDLIISALSSDVRIVDAQALLEKHKPHSGDFKKVSKRVMQIALAISDKELCAGVGRGIRNGAFGIGVAEFSGIDDFLTKFLAP